MRNPSYLIRSRHHIYYFRWPLPRQIRKQGKTNHVKISLQTREPKEALRMAMGGWFSTQTLFWIHLAKANLISGINNDVLNGIGADEYKAGSNYPASKMGGGVIANYNDIYSLNGDDPALSRNYLWLVGNGEVVGTGYVAFLWGNANKSLTAAQAEQIDRKMDDGFPFTGAVFTYSPSPDNKCHTPYTTPVPSNSAYSSSMSGKNCVTGIQLD